MKPLLYTAPLLLALSLGACQKPHIAAESSPITKDVTAQTTGLGENVTKIDARAVWQGSLDACRDATTAADACLINILRTRGASPSAINAARTLSAQGKPGYISAWQPVEGVGVATLEFPFRANTNQGIWLVDAAGKTVDVDEEVLDAGVRNLPEYKAFIDKHPDASPFAPAEASGSDALPDGGVRLRFTTPLRSCHACADEGHVTIGYDFDTKRSFKGKQLVELR
ncbi:hypothetical protein [Stenotrophomonas sp. Iso1]|uniref:hypothetical protein n=1 Tax=Stenotrophomonas sp. Iso1 TaxID=2977283 RepID=UPI0022B77D65|nr:hypothetical protein [Stenotrophomonas sp. Iso1]